MLCIPTRPEALDDKRKFYVRWGGVEHLSHNRAATAVLINYDRKCTGLRCVLKNNFKV
jgi:hypothetical protein